MLIFLVIIVTETTTEIVSNRFQNWKDSRFSRKQAYKVFGRITATQGLIKKPIKVTLAGFSHDPFTNRPQWTWIHNGVHKWGPRSGSLNLEIFKANATSGDDISIEFKNGWIVKKF